MKKMKSVSILLIALLFLQILPIFRITAYAADPEAYFPDVNLNKEIHEWLSIPVTDSVYKSDIEKKLADSPTTFGRWLDFSNSNITDLTGMEIFEGLPLTAISLDSNNITDITPLQNITDLDTLFMRINYIEDITPLKNLINLKTLDIADNKISDISIVTPSNFPGIDDLSIGGNSISDYSIIGSLTTLKRLYIGDQTSNDEATRNNWEILADNIDFVRSLDLEYLNIEGSYVTDLSPVSGLSNLYSFYGADSRITNLSALSGLVNLTELRIDSNFINYLDPVNQGVINFVKSQPGYYYNNNAQKKLVIADPVTASIKAAINITKGNTYSPHYKYFFTLDGTTFSNSIFMASPSYTSFTSSDSNIFTVDSNGLISAINTGSAQLDVKIFNTTADYTIATATVNVTAAPVTLQSITVTPATATVQVGNTQQYTAIANFSDGSTQDVTNVAAWALGDPTKATIHASGLATGTAAGNTGVSATWNGMTGNASLTVTAAPVTLQSITVTPATATVQVGNTQQYTATANFSDGSTQDVTNVAAWALGDPTKATIHASGLATGTAAGNTGVSATWNGMTGNASLTVTAA
uniref:Ig-like domain-containing protein n=1 Tax=Paenibacillus luteus TaxID=2545753 RepID=UPI0015896E50